MRGDKLIVLASVASHGRSLAHATPRLRGDPEVVLAAVRQDPMALQFAATRGEEQEAFRDSGEHLGYCPKKKKKPLRWRGHSSEAAAEGDAEGEGSAAPREVRAVVEAALSGCWWSFAFVEGRLRADPRIKQLLSAGIARDPEIQPGYTGQLKPQGEPGKAQRGRFTKRDGGVSTGDHREDEGGDNPQDSRGVPSEDPAGGLPSDAFLDVLRRRLKPWALRASPLVMACVCRVDGRALRFACPELRDHDEGLCEAAVKGAGYGALPWCGRAFRDDRAFMLRAVQVDGRCLRHASARVARDVEVKEAASAQAFVAAARRKLEAGRRRHSALLGAATASV